MSHPVYPGFYRSDWVTMDHQRDVAENDVRALLEVVSKASDVALVAMFGIDGFDRIKELRGRYL